MQIRRKTSSRAMSPGGTTPKEDGVLRLLVCGSRDWEDIPSLRFHILKMISDLGMRDYTNVLIILAQGNRGVAPLVRDLCMKELNIACALYPAAWEYWNALGKGRIAGPTRSFWIIRWGQPHAVLAFHPYLPNSFATKNLIKYAKLNGVTRIRVIKQ